MKTYLCLIIMSITVSTQAADKAFASTEPGSIEFKKIPAHTLIYSETDRSYFSENNGLFGKLFNYIQSNQIPMTTPVKADINPGKMYFYIGSPETHAPLVDTKGVKVVEEEAYWVISMAKEVPIRAKILTRPNKRSIPHLENQMIGKRRVPPMPSTGMAHMCQVL